MFEIGAQKWPGLSKLVEECGEVLQVVGKIIATRGDTKHWDGGPPLDERLLDELADLRAAINFVLIRNFTNDQQAAFFNHMYEKEARFMRWHEDDGKLIFERLQAEGGPISDVAPRSLSCGCTALDHPDRLRPTLALPPNVCALGWAKK